MAASELEGSWRVPIRGKKGRQVWPTTTGRRGGGVRAADSDVATAGTVMVG
jgi:hypothetical protein